MYPLLIIDADTKLADRTATLQTGSTSNAPKLDEEPSPSPPRPKDRKVSRDQVVTGSIAPGDALNKVRQDLGEAQRSRGLMEAKLKSVTEELNKLKIQSSLDSKRISELAKEKATLATGVRDRDEELRGKSKLLEVRGYFRWPSRSSMSISANGVAGRTR